MGGSQGQSQSGSPMSRAPAGAVRELAEHVERLIEGDQQAHPTYLKLSDGRAYP
jgi:hypothetical protein